MKPTVLKDAILLTANYSVLELNKHLDQDAKGLCEFLNSQVSLVEKVLLESRLDFVRINADVFQYALVKKSDLHTDLMRALNAYFEIYFKLKSNVPSYYKIAIKFYISAAC
jgi:hypothetical protein